PMVQTSDVAGGASHYTLPTAGGPDIMLTSKLSGCRFGVGSDAVGSCLVSYVQPDHAIPTRAAQQTDLTTQLNFAILLCSRCGQAKPCASRSFQPSSAIG